MPGKKKGQIARPLRERPHYKVAARIGWQPRKLGLWCRDHGIKTKRATESEIEAALRAQGVWGFPRTKKSKPEFVEVPEAKPRAVPSQRERTLDLALRFLHDAENHLQKYYECLEGARDIIRIEG